MNEKKAFKFIAGFRKSQGTQHSLATMLEKQENALDEKNIWACHRLLMKVRCHMTAHIP